MRSKQLIPDNHLTLAFDTSGPHCAVALFCGTSLLCAKAVDIKKGQAEQLALMAQGVLDAKGHKFAQVSRIGVGVGPGNYTGIRVALSFAHGLALSLSCPLVGVNSFEATYEGHDAEYLVIVPAVRDQVYVQKFPQPQNQPKVIPRSELGRSELPILDCVPAQILVEKIGKIAIRKTPKEIVRPTPLYVLPVNAAPARQKSPRILA